MFHQMGLGTALDGLPQARFERVELFLNTQPVGEITVAADAPGIFGARIAGSMNPPPGKAPGGGSIGPAPRPVV